MQTKFTGNLMTVNEISEFLAVKPARTYELARLWEESGGKRGLPCIRLGQRQLRFFPSSVETYLKNLENSDNADEEATDND